MARGSSYNIGSAPPLINWTVVRGDTASFRVYVTDDAKDPLVIEDWSILANFRRPSTAGNFDQEDATHILLLEPGQGSGDGDGEFTVSLLAAESEILETGDVFDIQLSDATRVWTVARGTMTIIEDVTDSGSIS